MKARSTLWIGAAFAFAGMAGAPAAAWAMTNNATTPTSTTAPATGEALPPAQHAGAIAWRSGGIGSGQSHAFKDAMSSYPLSLEFARHTASDGNEYLANVPVTISDMHGTAVLSTHSRGPFMLVTLPHGHYVVTARHDGNTQRRTIDIGRDAHVHEAFVWSM